MIKWLVVIGVIWFVYQFFIKQKKSPSKQKPKQTDALEAHDMVECSRCGVYVELQDAILSNGRYYCGNECLKGE